MAGDDLVRRLRLRAQRLEPRSREGAAAVVRDVCGIQAQDAVAARLSVRARTTGLTAAGVDGAGGLVRTWAWRGTLHLLPADDLAWVLPLVAPPAIRGVAARWRDLGLDEETYERAREAVGERLAEGPASRAELREHLTAGGVDASGQRLPHLLRRVALEGRLHHPLDDTFAALEPRPGPPREQALTELARRYLAAYGPAEAGDLAAWSGLPTADANTAWGQVLHPTTPDSGARMQDLTPVVRLLPSFDTYLLGYRDRELAVAPEHARRVRPGGGWLHPVLLVDGRAAGTWRRDGDAVAVRPFAPLPREVMPALESEAADVGRFLGAPAHLTLEGG